MAAYKARNYQALWGWPSTSTFISFAPKNLMTNCDITADNIKQAEHIYGTPTPLSKVKTKKKTPNKNYNTTRITFLLLIVNKRRYLKMCKGILYVNRMVF